MAYNLTGRINKTPGELKYVDNIKSKENQSDVVEASNAVDAIPEMSKLNTEIEELEAVTPVDKNEARVKKQKLRELRDKKYDLKADLSENYLALDEETRKEVTAKLGMIMVNEETISAQGANPELSNVLREENKKLKAEIERLKSLLHGSSLDLKHAEEVRLKLTKEINRLSEIVDYLNDRIRKFNNGI